MFMDMFLSHASLVLWASDEVSASHNNACYTDYFIVNRSTKI